MKDGPILLIDAYNIFARAYCVIPLYSSHGHHLGGSVGFLKSLSKLVNDFKPSKVIVCWEGGGSARRRQILPEYKMNRKPMKLNRSKIYDDIPNTVENFNYQIELTTKLLKQLPVQQIYVEECEADDVIGYISKYKYLDSQKIIISMDQDLHQLLGPTCVQYSPALKKTLDANYVLQRYGVSVNNFITARSFIGDPSDGIPGIRGCGFRSLVKRFPELALDEFISVDDILSICEDRAKTKKLKMYENILNNKSVPRRNWKIMYLDTCNLSAEHIKNLEYRSKNQDLNCNKFELIKILITEGIDIPRGINVDVMFMRINSCVIK